MFSYDINECFASQTDYKVPSYWANLSLNNSPGWKQLHKIPSLCPWWTFSTIKRGQTGLNSAKVALKAGYLGSAVKSRSFLCYSLLQMWRQISTSHAGHIKPITGEGVKVRHTLEATPTTLMKTKLSKNKEEKPVKNTLNQTAFYTDSCWIISGTCTLIEYFNFRLLYTSTPLHFWGKYCTFYSTTYLWQL